QPLPISTTRRPQVAESQPQTPPRQSSAVTTPIARRKLRSIRSRLKPQRPPRRLSNTSHLGGFMRLFAVVAALALLSPFGWTPVRDLGQWEGTDPVIASWFKNLRQPDAPSVSCCGESDAYYADSFEIDGDKYVAIITDERPDGPLARPHIPPGTRIV